ncbi:helix-turn-helix domain-containing protein [Liquorilactobacillus mali]|uniref:Transcriptional regulator n=1 Tax=Liquorilactobacillus mali KCTC 3596 = DSM 20444 TaxID=1046596 RepID=J1F4X8_9LACO|nr:helix-turn-helix domain-containing protein [Liquorilactobacillus mali]EJF00952.1 transcriptional regulator [Liquorilactobacillus mali KCTC 3596 = DSM 20444]KRN11522.1 transcriptional regulator [Liquorilactobacillus mali KCTC 3596 = DSM 20444]QFQ74271.1 helix-turn-helix domain-containing protein [Liquorilactobacillus mali]
MVEIGKSLQAARIEKGYTLDDLQQITKIQKRYLIAIEDERFEALPGDFYVKAFIKQYAECVDVDPTEFLSAFESQKATASDAVEKTAKTRSEVTRESIQKSNKVNRFLGYLPTIIVVAVVVVILGSIYYVAWSKHQEDAQTQQIESSSKVSVSSQKDSKSSSSSTSSSSSSSSSESKKSSSKNSKKSSSSKTKKEKSSKSKISLASSSGSKFVYTMTKPASTNTVKFAVDGSKAWSAVSSNGTQQWQGTLSSGESHEVSLPSGTTAITINLGNSEATTLTINGKKFNYKKDNSSLTVRTITINLED